MTDENLEIPECLRRPMTPEVRARLDRIRIAHHERKIVSPDGTGAARNKLLRLRREEKRLSSLIDDIGSRDNARRTKLYAMIRDVEREIDRVQHERDAIGGAP